MSKNRRNHSALFKAKVALEAMKGEKTIHEIAAKHQIHPTQVTQWKRQLVERAADVFDGKRTDEKAEDSAQLYAKIGELMVERDFLSRALGK